MTHKLFIIGLLVSGLMACNAGVIHIHATYERLSGVAMEDQVLFQDNVAGSVADIQFNEEGTYHLKLRINSGFANAVTEYSQFHIIDDPHRKGRKAVEIRLVKPGGKRLASGARVQGETPPGKLAERLKEDLEAGFGFVMSQMEKFNRDIEQIPESDAYKALKESMEALAEEVQRAEKGARDKLKNEWLPKIERELDSLRKQLRQLGREKELQLLEEKIERIRRL